MEHTKTPWKPSSSFLVCDAHGKIIANTQPVGIEGITTTYDEGEANTEFICRAANCHDDRLETCKQSLA